jgi:hypothetical protein
MFSNSKPTASLSSGLLARKGQARPAMRPQGFHGHGMNLDDLGWNDMGEAFAGPEPVLAAVPSIAHEIVADVPPVLVEREMLREEIAAEAETPIAPVALPQPKSVSVATASRIQREVKAGKPKAAFTLRLDTDRHLRLRLAVATRNRSAQALVTDALDALLASLPEVEELARQIPALKAVRSSGGK